jgi:tetratricopeptide (TPR) repeat protein
LGNVLIRYGRLQEAEAAYLASLKLDPEQPAAHANLGVVYYQQGEMAKAAASFEQALRIDEQDASTLYLLAAVRLQENDLEAAEPLLKEALRADPALPETYYGLGVLYRLKGQKADAIAAFEKFLEIGPGQDASAVDQARGELEALQAE